MTAALAARREVRRKAHNYVLALPGAHEVITVNDDFTDEQTDVLFLLRTRQPLAVGAQESKKTDYRARLDGSDGMDGDRWGVRQRMTDAATAGVAVLWDRRRAHTLGHARDARRAYGSGFETLVTPHSGEDMLARGVVWQDLVIRGTEQAFRLGSAHRPPLRHSHLWPHFDDRLEAWLEASPLPVVLAMDNNQPGGPDVDDDFWKWSGIGIDGHLTTGHRMLSVYELEHRHSDHRAVSGALHTARLPVLPAADRR